MPLTKFNFIDLVVIGSYYLTFLLLSLSLTGLFERKYLLIGLAVGVLSFLLFFRKRFIWEKQHLYFFIAIPLVLVGVLLIRGCFGGDGIDFWLPWAREITLHGEMPDFLFNTVVWATTRMPLAAIIHAGVFNIFGFSNWAIALPPFFFASACGLLLYLWLKEKGLSKKYIIFGFLLLLASPIFLDRAGEIGQEPFILFFFTATLYYLEKLEKEASPHYFGLALASAVLAALAKESGFIVFLPILWAFFKNKIYQKYSYSLLLIFPLLLWLLRTYLIYDNPVFPLFSSFFKGRYYELLLMTDSIFQTYIPSLWNNIPARIADIGVSLISLFCPLAILSFCGFYLKRKIQYILLFVVFFFLIFFVIPNPGDYCRYFMPLLIVFIVYALSALAEIKSRVLLSIVFFVNLGALFFTKVASSQSQFFSPIENKLGELFSVSQLLHDYHLVTAFILAAFFYFVISRHENLAKMLILISASVFSVEAYSFNLGSWLNIWLPILALVFLILIWRFVAAKLKEETLWKSGAIIAAVLILFNSWGLALAYTLAHRQIVFPNFEEAYGAQPEAARVIENIEGENRDFYIYAASASYFSWYHNLKTVISRGMTFHVITNLEWREDLDAATIHDLFERSNIRYIVKNHLNNIQLEPFFAKIGSRPDLFEPIFQKQGAYLWRLK